MSFRTLSPAQRRWLPWAIVIIGAVFLVYGRALWHDFVLWDDDALIVDNPVVRSLSPWSIRRAFTMYDPELYIPLTFVSYQIDVAIAGLRPFMMHFTNLLLHAVNALLVGAIAFRLSRRDAWIAGAAGLLFALHPLQTEAVVWASARKDLLASAFFLVSVLCYLRYRKEGTRGAYLWSLGAFGLALLSKIVVVVLPVAFLLIDWRDGRPINRRSIVEILPFFALSVIFGIVALYGKQEQVVHVTILETALIAVRTVMLALQHFALPLHLSPLYPYLGLVTTAAFTVPVLLFAALSAAALWSLRRTREGMFAFLWFLLLMSPTLLNFRKGEGGDIYLGSDRYAYLPSLAVFFLAALIYSRVRAATPRRIADAAFAALLLLMGFLSYTQVGIWRDSETLFRSVIVDHPQAQAAHHNLGVLYQRQGRAQDAMEQYQLALEIAPKASTLANIGDLLRENGQTLEAMTEYQEALKFNPKSVDALLGMGLAHVQRREADAAIEQFRAAIAADPANAQAHVHLGVALLMARRPEDAVAEYRMAVALDPFSAGAYFNLGVVLERLGRTGEATEAYKRAIELDPSLAQAHRTSTK